MNENKVLPFPPSDERTCLNCGGTDLRTTVEEQSFPYGVGTDAVMLEASVPVRHCDSCGFSYTDDEAEDLRHDAVCRHLEVMTPKEVASVRKRAGMSTAEFSRLSGIGTASVHRWESGALIQNAANDHFLFLLTFPENIERIKNRDRKAPIWRSGDSDRSAATTSRSKFRSISPNHELRETASKFVLCAS